VRTALATLPATRATRAVEVVATGAVVVWVATVAAVAAISVTPTRKLAVTTVAWATPTVVATTEWVVAM
jgi:hypothetical protein